SERTSGSSPGGASRATWVGSGSSVPPDGLILIEGHAGLSFEREWAAIASTGLDPARVKYVLATHEHGDHAPGAFQVARRRGDHFTLGPLVPEVRGPYAD